jgi:hypothetical protein
MLRRETRREITIRIGLALTLAVSIGIAACEGGGPDAYGEPIDPAEAVPLSKLLSGDDVDRSEAVTVSGTIGEVCRSAGCWFVLRDLDERDGKHREILVDLKGGANFTVPASIEGRRALVYGRLVGEKPDWTLNGLGLVLE